MKPHADRSADRRFSFGASAVLLLLVSACSTFSLPSDTGPTAAAGERAMAVAPEEADSVAIAVLPGVLPAPRQLRRRMASAASQAGVPMRPLDPFAQPGAAPADAQLQALMDSPIEDAALEMPPVAGPVPKLEPLARHANRPYRLRGRKYRPLTQLQPFRQRGVASWYGRAFHGRRTATGERFDMNAMSAAHPTLPLPSYVRVTNLVNGTSVIVRVNDRGPYAHDRVIDLSKEAARHLGLLKGGLAAVELNLIVPEPTGTEMPAPVAGISD